MPKRITGRHQTTNDLTVKAKIGGAIFGTFLAWFVLSISLAASHGEYSSDAAAADFAPKSQASATAAAEQRLKDGDPAGAAIFAKQALAISPISAASLRSLGFAEQALNHGPRASALLSQAAALGWRDQPTQIWLAQAFLQQNDATEALQRIDAVLRTTDDATTLYGSLDQLIGNQNFASALLDRLRLNPAWRFSYLRYVESEPPAELEAKAQIIGALARSATPPNRFEVLPIVIKLVQNGQVSRARALWFTTQHMPLSSVFDPHFQHIGTSLENGPFEWIVDTIPGVNAESDGGGSFGVNLSSDGSGSGSLIHQVTMLTPGAHTLEYTASRPFSPKSPFSWRVRCIANGQLLLDSSAAGANGESHPFVVPNDCESQSVELHVASNPSADDKSAKLFSLAIR